MDVYEIIIIAIIALMGVGLVYQAYRLREAMEEWNATLDLAKEYEGIINEVEEENDEFFKAYEFCLKYKPYTGELYMMADHIRSHVYMSEDFKSGCDQIAQMLDELYNLDIKDNGTVEVINIPDINIEEV